MSVREPAGGSSRRRYERRSAWVEYTPYSDGRSSWFRLGAHVSRMESRTRRTTLLDTHSIGPAACRHRGPSTTPFAAGRCRSVIGRYDRRDEPESLVLGRLQGSRPEVQSIAKVADPWESVTRSSSAAAGACALGGTTRAFVLTSEGKIAWAAGRCQNFWGYSTYARRR